MKISSTNTENVNIASILYNYKKSLNIETSHLTILNTGPFCAN